MSVLNATNRVVNDTNADVKFMISAGFQIGGAKGSVVKTVETLSADIESIEEKPEQEQTVQSERQAVFKYFPSHRLLYADPGDIDAAGLHRHLRTVIQRGKQRFYFYHRPDRFAPAIDPTHSHFYLRV